MKTLYVVSDITYPPVEGLHQQTYMTIQCLIEQGYDIDVVGFVKHPVELDAEALQLTLGIRGPISLIPYSGSQTLQGLKIRFSKWAFKRRTEYSALLSKVHDNKYAVVHLEGAAACGLYTRKLKRRAVIGLIDPGSRRQLRFALHTKSRTGTVRALLSAGLSALLELSVRVGQPVWHVVSHSDASFLRKLYHHQNVHTISVTVAGIANPNSVSSVRAPSLIERWPLRAVVYGDLRQAHMRSSFVETLGKNLPNWRRLANFELNVTVLGRVSRTEVLEAVLGDHASEFIEWADDYVAVLQSGDVIIVPDLIGTGIKNRVIQSMALGKVVIGTPVAFEGIPITHGVNAIILADSGELSKELIQAFRNQSYREEIGVRAQMLVRMHFSPTGTAKQWGTLYKSIVRASGG